MYRKHRKDWAKKKKIRSSFSNDDDDFFCWSSFSVKKTDFMRIEKKEKKIVTVSSASTEKEK